MGVAAGERDLEPPEALAVGDDADLLALGLEDGALFDVQLEHGVDRAGADLLFSDPADAGEFVAEALALGVAPVIGVVERMDAREDARGEHRGGEAGAFLVGPVDEHDGVAGADVEVVEGADDLEPAEHAEHPVVFAARRLGVEMAAHVDGKCSGISAFAAGEHVAYAVDTQRQAGLGAPAGEEVPAFAVGIRQGLAVVAAGDAGADPGHFHQAVPEAGAVDAQVGAGHGALSGHGWVSVWLALRRGGKGLI